MATTQTIPASQTSKIQASLQALVPAAELPQYERMRNGLLADTAPQGMLQEVIFEHLMHAAWDQRRFRILQGQLVHQIAAAGLDPVLDPRLESRVKLIDRYLRDANQRFRWALNELRRLQTEKAVRNVAAESSQAADAPVTGLVDTAKIARARRAKRLAAAQNAPAGGPPAPAARLATQPAANTTTAAPEC